MSNKYYKSSFDKLNWRKGDLLLNLRKHDLVRVVSKKYFYVVLEKNEVVMALEPNPEVGMSSRIKVLHRNNIWIANSNYFERKDVLL